MEVGSEAAVDGGGVVQAGLEGEDKGVLVQSSGVCTVALAGGG